MKHENHMSSVGTDERRLIFLFFYSIFLPYNVVRIEGKIKYIYVRPLCLENGQEIEIH